MALLASIMEVQFPGVVDRFSVSALGAVFLARWGFPLMTAGRMAGWVCLQIIPRPQTPSQICLQVKYHIFLAEG